MREIDDLVFLPDKQVSVWVWALCNPLFTGAGATAYATWTTKPVEAVVFVATKTTEFGFLFTLFY